MFAAGVVELDEGYTGAGVVVVVVDGYPGACVVTLHTGHWLLIASWKREQRLHT